MDVPLANGEMHNVFCPNGYKDDKHEGIEASLDPPKDLGSCDERVKAADANASARDAQANQRASSTRAGYFPLIDQVRHCRAEMREHDRHTKTWLIDWPRTV
jgi:hypothetical protein